VVKKRAILSAKTSRAVNRDPITEWQQILLEIIGIVSKVGPWFSIRMMGKKVVNRRDALWCEDIGHIPAEVKEVISGICWVPVEFLPRVGWVVIWSSNLR
jgi:hypothetical protein